MSGGEPILLFQLGPRLYATRAGAVVRIEGTGGPARGDTCLGSPFAAQRRLVVGDGQGGLAGLPVDAVLAVRQVAAADLRPLPPLAAGLAAPAVTGLVMWDGVPTPLVDLSTLLQEPPGADARGERSRDG